MRRLAVALLLALCFAPTNAGADTKPENLNSEETGEDVDALTEQSDDAQDFEDLQALKDLEAQSFRPILLDGSGPFDPDLLGPAAGTLADIQRDSGRISELLAHRKPRAGSELLAIPAVRQRFQASSMFELTAHDQPSVRAYLDFFDGRGKRILAKWIRRMGHFRPLIEQVMAEEGLPADLIYVAMIESGFSPYAKSPASAVGVWQFIPTTGLDMGLRIDRWVDERRDPVKATRAAAKYLKLLHSKFGSWPLALAAYNGGPGLVAKEVRRHNSNNYWRIQRNSGMYDETRRYVPKIIAAGLVTKNADVFGLDGVSPEAHVEWTTVSVPAKTRLSLVAQAADVPIDVVARLNAELVRKQTPPSPAQWPVKIPPSSLAKFVANFDGFVRREGAEHKLHTVRFGETLHDVAASYQVAPRVIRVANGIEARERVSYGDELVIPTKALGSWKPKADSKDTLVVPKAAIKAPGQKRWFYRVNDGDTLEVLARGLGVRASDLVLWNDLDPNAKLPKDLLLQVFLLPEANVDSLALLDADRVNVVAAGSAEHKKIKRKRSSKKSRRLYHKVRSGDSLWKIANKYKVTVEDLRKWNRKIPKSNVLQPGQKLVVYRGRK